MSSQASQPPNAPAAEQSGELQSGDHRSTTLKISPISKRVLNGGKSSKEKQRRHGERAKTCRSRSLAKDGHRKMHHDPRRPHTWPTAESLDPSEDDPLGNMGEVEKVDEASEIALPVNSYALCRWLGGVQLEAAGTSPLHLDVFGYGHITHEALKTADDTHREKRVSDSADPTLYAGYWDSHWIVPGSAISCHMYPLRIDDMLLSYDQTSGEGPAT